MIIATLAEDTRPQGDHRHHLRGPDHRALPGDEEGETLGTAFFRGQVNCYLRKYLLQQFKFKKLGNASENSND